MTTEHEGQQLMDQTAKAFVDSLFRAMAVSGDDENGEPKRITQQELADRSGVGRSTIAKYTTMKPGDTSVNPDLDTICSIAAALNIPPALLLMRPEDWSNLAQASRFLNDAVDDNKFQGLLKSIVETPNPSQISNSQAGVRLAINLDLHSENPQTEGITRPYIDQIQKRHAKIRHGIRATSALPPLGKNKSQTATLLPLCAIIGAQLNSVE